MSVELHFDSEFVGLNTTLTSTTSPLTYTIKTPTTTLPQLTTFARNDLPEPFATIEWRGMSARLHAPGWGLPDVDLDEWLHKTRWWSPSREFEAKSGQFRWNDSVWLPDWIFKQKLTMTPASDEKHPLVTISFGPLKEPIMHVEAEGLTLVPLDMIVLTGVVMLYYKKAQQGAGSGS